MNVIKWLNDISPLSTGVGHRTCKFDTRWASKLDYHGLVTGSICIMDCVLSVQLCFVRGHSKKDYQDWFIISNETRPSWFWETWIVTWDLARENFLKVGLLSRSHVLSFLRHLITPVHSTLATIFELENFSLPNHFLGVKLSVKIFKEYHHWHLEQFEFASKACVELLLS